MKLTTLARLVPAAGLALSLGLAQAAVAQTASGTMAPTAAPAAAAPVATTTAAPMTKAQKKAAAKAAKTAKTSATATAAAPAAKAAPATTSGKMPADEQFKTQAEAAAHCPADTVVWASMTKTGTYHMSTSKYYGKTKHGAYVCTKDATAAGMHAAKN